MKTFGVCSLWWKSSRCEDSDAQRSARASVHSCAHRSNRIQHARYRGQILSQRNSIHHPFEARASVCFNAAMQGQVEAA